MPESRKNTENEQPAAVEAAEAAPAEPAPEPPDERVWAALHAAGEKKALDLVVLDLRAVAQFTDFFLIASGTNVRQVQAIADAVVEDLRKKHRARPARVEGYNAAEWVLLDYGDFIFHVFEEKARRFYDLERLWRDAARVPVPPDAAGGGAGSLRSET
ncbi:MAG TPA: ribosome silencing factor [Pyrinomonadaceae bacterium]|jgi:ribosome-associated protein|nr:ribosome silencing factor [Pyrinomonadaceae bacterium]